MLPQARTKLLLLLLLAAITFIAFLHLYLLVPGVDAGLHLYGSMLITKGMDPYNGLWNNKPPLIYLIGSIGFFYKQHPFLGVRIIELIAFAINLVFIRGIVKNAALGSPLIYMLAFCGIYLVCWDRGFLTETFTIPLTLFSFYLFVNRNRYFEFIVPLLFVAATLFKQNGGAVIACLIITDIFSNYRKQGVGLKSLKHLLSFIVYACLLFFTINRSGFGETFLDQVILHDFAAMQDESLFNRFRNHLFHNSFLSIRGVSVIMGFNLFVLLMIFKELKARNSNENNPLVLSILLVYLLSYILVYFNGKSYPHYFMLLIVPATFITGYYGSKWMIGWILIFALILIGAWQNIQVMNINQYRKKNLNEGATYIRVNTKESDRIHVAGFGNQYIHVLCDRLSNTKFVMPMLDSTTYTFQYREAIRSDFQRMPPVMIVLNRKGYKTIGNTGFYAELITDQLSQYNLVMQNEQFDLYRKK